MCRSSLARSATSRIATGYYRYYLKGNCDWSKIIIVGDAAVAIRAGSMRDRELLTQQAALEG